MKRYAEPAHFRVFLLTTVVLGIAACGGGTSSGTNTTSTTSTSGTNSTFSSSSSAGATPGCATAASGTQLLSYSNMQAAVSETLPYNYTWGCSGTLRSLTGNGVPNHDVTGGKFATKISAQTISQTFPLTPALTTASVSIQVPGYAINSVKFEPGTAGTCLSTATSHASGCNDAGGTGPWKMEALPGSVSPWLFDFGVDTSNAHVQPNGQYHYHGIPVGLIPKLNNSSTSTMTLAGWAKDGFPIYARYGHSNALDPASALKVVTGSYRVKTTPDAGRPSIVFFAMGHFQQDWQYVAGSGDLDECNGRYGATPEYPLGIYHYYITDTYPFIQRCVKGST